MKKASKRKKGPFLKAALSYAAQGWPVIPIKPGAKKPPLVDGWPETASVDPATIKQWWKDFPNANIAVLTGSRSRLVVVDVDQHGADGFKTLQALTREHGQLPSTVISKTPNGGKHFFFTTTEQFRCNSGTALGVGIDVRAEAGYVLVAPSIIGGKRYAWSRS